MVLQATDVQHTPLSWDEIEQLGWDELEQAKLFMTNISVDRMDYWKRYYGKPYGNELIGRSRHVTRDVMNDIEWVLPYYIRTFTADDEKFKIVFENAPKEIGAAIKKKIKQDMDKGSPSQFVFFYTWFKDSQVSGTAGVKLAWEYEKERVTQKLDIPLSIAQMNDLNEDPELALESTPEPSLNEAGEIVFNNVEFSAEQVTVDKFTPDNIPHWEILFSEESRGVNDDHGIGNKTTVTVDYLKRIDRAHRERTGEAFFKYLKELEAGQLGKLERKGTIVQHADDRMSEAEKDAYYDYLQRIGPETEEVGPRRKVDLVEWHTRLDVDGDGFLEDVTLWYANNYLIRWELNKEGFKPICVLSPILDCYKINGIGWGELLTEVQNLHTQIIRRILDTFAFHVKGLWRRDPHKESDSDAIYHHVPGDVIDAEEGALEDISPKQMDMAAPLGMLAIVSEMRQERSGVTKMNQGSLSQSAGQQPHGMGQTPDRGIQRLMMEGQKRMDMVARIYAETGLKDFYEKAVKLYQLYMDKPFTVKIKGQEVNVTPDMIKGPFHVEVQMPVEKAVGMNQAQQIQGIIASVVQMAQAYPALLDPMKGYDAASKMIAVQGEDPEDFLPGKQEYAQRVQQLQQTGAMEKKQQDMMNQMFLKMEELDRKLEGEKIAADVRKEDGRIRQKKREANLDFIVDMLELMLKGDQEKAKMMFEQTKARMESNDRQAERTTRLQENAIRGLRGNQNNP